MTSFKEPIDFYNYATGLYKAVPKTAAEGKAVLEKVQAIVKTESDNYQEVAKTYAKIAKGDATANEIAKANKKAAELAKTAAFASFIAIPGALFALPLVAEKAKEYSIDFIPASVAEQFSI